MKDICTSALVKSVIRFEEDRSYDEILIFAEGMVWAAMGMQTEALRKAQNIAKEIVDSVIVKIPDDIPALLQESSEQLPYTKGSDTSRWAAESMVEFAKTQEGMVYRHIRKQATNGATDDETENVLDLRHQTASARRRGLVLKSLVFDSGMRRATRSGREATVWVSWQWHVKNKGDG